jgi:hypothetical protein
VYAVSTPYTGSNVKFDTMKPSMKIGGFVVFWYKNRWEWGLVEFGFAF